jgi:hypothetical protein
MTCFMLRFFDPIHHNPRFPVLNDLIVCKLHLVVIKNAKMLFT